MSSQPTSLISIVVPAYSKQEVLTEFHQRLSAVLNILAYVSEIIYANDGNQDDTLTTIDSLYHEDNRVAVVDLSRNYDKEIALTDGLHKAKCNAVIVIDADLQYPPEVDP